MSNKDVEQAINEGYLQLLEAMCRDCVDVFEGGVRDYLDAVSAVDISFKQLGTAVSECTNALKDYKAAMQRKKRAAKIVQDEFKFLNGQETTSPQLPQSGKEITLQILEKILSEDTEGTEIKE